MIIRCASGVGTGLARALPPAALAAVRVAEEEGSEVWEGGTGMMTMTMGSYPGWEGMVVVEVVGA